MLPIIPAFALNAGQPDGLIIPRRPSLVMPTDEELTQFDPFLGILPFASPMLLGGGGSGPPVWTGATLSGPGSVTQSAGWSGFTLRQRIDTSIIPFAFNRVRFAVKGGTSEGITVTAAYIAIQGVGSVDFASGPTQAFFNSGSAGCVAGIGVTQYSDTISLVRTAGQSVVISLWTVGTATAADNYTVNTNITGTDSFFKNANDPTSLVASGYTTNSHQCHVTAFEVSL